MGSSAPEDALICRALRLRQQPGRPLFLFTLRASELLRVARAKRLGRDEEGDLTGYQRPPATKSVRNISAYLNTEGALFPSTLTLALPPSARFEADEAYEKFSSQKSNHQKGRPEAGGRAVSGRLKIPLPAEGEPPPLHIVDGQQRAAALSSVDRPDFPVPVGAFISGNAGLEREQFFRLNSTKRLPRSLVAEILPSIDGPLPSKWDAKKAPSALCEWLSRAPASPLQGMVRRASMSPGERRRACVADMPLISSLQQSLTSPSGCLFPYHNVMTGDVDHEGARALLSAYWTAVRSTFPDAWNRPSKESRLMHSAGIRAMMRLMDHLVGPSTLSAGPKAARASLEEELAHVAPACAWTEGRWPILGGLRWNEIKGSSRHVEALSGYLRDVHLHGPPDA